MSRSVWIVGVLGAILFCIIAFVAYGMNWLLELMSTVRTAVLIGEAIFAVVFFIKNLDVDERDTHPILSVVSSVICLAASYFVLTGLCNYIEAGRNIFFVIQMIISGGILFCLVLPGWVSLNNAYGRWGLLCEVVGMIVLIAIHKLVMYV